MCSALLSWQEMGVETRRAGSPSGHARKVKKGWLVVKMAAAEATGARASTFSSDTYRLWPCSGLQISYPQFLYRLAWCLLL